MVGFIYWRELVFCMLSGHDLLCVNSTVSQDGVGQCGFEASNNKILPG